MGAYGTAIFGGVGMAILGLVVSIPILMIIKSWLVDGTLDAAVACGMIGAVLCLFGATWAAQGTFWMLVFVALLIGGCIFIPIWCTRQEKIDFKELRDDDMDRYRRAIEFDPQNASAYVFLGDALMERGSCIAAIAQYERALALKPDNGAWKRKLRNAREAEASKNSR